MSDRITLRMETSRKEEVVCKAR